MEINIRKFAYNKQIPAVCDCKHTVTAHTQIGLIVGYPFGGLMELRFLLCVCVCVCGCVYDKKNIHIGRVRHVHGFGLHRDYRVR